MLSQLTNKIRDTVEREKKALAKLPLAVIAGSCKTMRFKQTKTCTCKMGIGLRGTEFDVSQPWFYHPGACHLGRLNLAKLCRRILKVSVKSCKLFVIGCNRAWTSSRTNLGLWVFFPLPIFPSLCALI